MSTSTDSLKKKVCVTVFLDELFEEVPDEDEKDLKQTISPEAIKETELKEVPRTNPKNEEKVNDSPSLDTKEVQIQCRPRKHRKESKFSKNHCSSFKNELTKYGYSSRCKTETGGCEHVDSTASESDLDLGGLLEIEKWTVGNSRSSFSGQSDVDMTEESYLSVNPVPSSMRICYSKPDKNIRNKLNSRPESIVSIRNKSTQFDGLDPGEGERKDGNIGNDVSLTEEGAGRLAWTKTQRQIRVIMAKAMKRHAEKKTCEGDRFRHYDLRSILEEWVRTEKNGSSKGVLVLSDGVSESDGYDLSDSYTRVLPHNQQTTTDNATNMRKVWARARKSDGFDSDLSETDCKQYVQPISFHTLRDDSVLCYSLRLKHENCDSVESDKQNENSDALESVAYSEAASRESSFDSIKSKGCREADSAYRALIRVTKAEALGTKLSAEKEIRDEGDLLVNTEKSLARVEGRNKNFAEGDAFKKPLNQDSEFLLNVKEKDNLFVCNEILKQVVESNAIHNELVVNRAEVKFNSAEQPKASSNATGELAEVFFKKNLVGNLEKNIMDIESEMVFAESQNFCENEDFSSDDFTPSITVRSSSQPNDICVLEFEDKLSRSKILKRLKTVEILGDNSLSGMKSISTEVILICENISNNEVCLETWPSSASTLKSITEMGQCYLKDSKDSAMYLIEIPLHFIHADQKKPSETERISKAPDSD